MPHRASWLLLAALAPSGCTRENPGYLGPGGAESESEGEGDGEGGGVPLPDVELDLDDWCPPAPRCGGDPTGSWELIGGCVPLDESETELESEADLDCPNLDVDLEMQAGIRYHLGADGRYAFRAAAVVRVALFLPDECLDGSTCDDLEVGLREDGDDWSCAQTGDACDCATESRRDTVENGDWSTEGGRLVLQPDGGDERVNVAYCVQDDVLEYGSFDPDADDGTLRLARAD